MASSVFESRQELGPGYLISTRRETSGDGEIYRNTRREPSEPAKRARPTPHEDDS